MASRTVERAVEVAQRLALPGAAEAEDSALEIFMVNRITLAALKGNDPPLGTVRALLNLWREQGNNTEAFRDYLISRHLIAYQPALKSICLVMAELDTLLPAAGEDEVEDEVEDVDA